MASFNGDRLKWTEFWDSFECTVHNNRNLSGIEKMNYLNSKLTGEAKRAISGLALSNENYTVAVKILKERFGKVQEVVDLHYSRMININPPRDTTESLRSFLDEIERHLRSLEVLKQDVNQDVFVSMVKSKLPQRVLLQLEMQKDSEVRWTIHLLRDRLKHYVIALESSEVAPRPSSFERRPTTQNPVRFSSHTKTDYTRRNVLHNPGSGSADYTRSNALHTPGSGSAEALIVNVKRSKSEGPAATRFYADQCRYCSNKHYSDECLKYKTVDDRKRKIKGSCFRCLSEGHIASECKRNRTCVYCGEINKHHRSLCPKQFNMKTLR